MNLLMTSANEKSRWLATAVALALVAYALLHFSFGPTDRFYWKLTVGGLALVWFGEDLAQLLKLPPSRSLHVQSVTHAFIVVLGWLALVLAAFILFATWSA